MDEKTPRFFSESKGVGFFWASKQEGGESFDGNTPTCSSKGKAPTRVGAFEGFLCCVKCLLGVKE